MYTRENLSSLLRERTLDPRLEEVFGKLSEAELEKRKNQIRTVLAGLNQVFPDNPAREVALVSAPGRTELGGNHTDHQNGNILAASVNLDMMACAARNDKNLVRLYSEGYGLIEVDLSMLDPIEEEKETTASLVRGMSAQFGPVGFDAYVISSVPGGSGLSSSAAFETLLGNIIVTLQGKEADPVEIAKKGQIVENQYFGKPSGLMDQMASSVGGIIEVDFEDPDNPKIEKILCDFHDYGYQLMVIDTHSSHADLTEDYAKIPSDMEKIARYFGKEHLREVDEKMFEEHLGDLNREFGTVPVSRAMHFFYENNRARSEAEALREGRFEDYLKMVRHSGDSSEYLLQNIIPSNGDQSVKQAIDLAKESAGKESAVRVHGGGFAGTIQAYVRDDLVDAFIERMESRIGPGCCHRLNIRPTGGCEI